MTSPDLSEFIKLSKPPKPRCKAGVALGALTAPEREQFAAACAARDQIPTGALVKWLQARGVEVAQSSVVHHRAGSCSCHDDS